jgi:hypothetical protein
MARLAAAVAQCSSLTAVEFEHLQAPDATIKAFFEALGARKAPNIVFRSCSVTDDILESVCSHIQRRRRKTGTIGAVQFIDCQISEFAMSVIQKVQDGETFAQAIAVSQPSSEASSVTSELSVLSPEGVARPIVAFGENIFGRDMRLFGLRSGTREEQLIAENTRLIVQIERMQRIIRDVNERGAIYIVGRGCQSVLDLMNDIDTRLDALRK